MKSSTKKLKCKQIWVLFVCTILIVIEALFVLLIVIKALFEAPNCF